MTHKKSFWFSSNGLAAGGLIAISSYFLLIEHREHLFQWLPYLILLLCPLMHIFMHGGHDHGKSGDHGGDSENDSESYKRGLEEGRKQSDKHQSH